MSYGAPVTGPMEIPQEVYRSQFAPPTPEMAELPEIIDARTTGLRLQGTMAKALPGMADVGSMTNAREMEAAQYANDIRAAFDITRQYEKRNKAVAKAKGRQAQRIAEKGSRAEGKGGVKRSQYNDRLGSNSKFRGAQNLTGPSAMPYLFAIR